MEILSYLLPFVYLVMLESLTVRWVAGGPIQGLVSRIVATNVTGIALLLLISMSGWFFGWWPDIRNWALRDSFLLFLLIKYPIFAFLFRRWGFQRVFTLHVLSNFVSASALSLLFIYSPLVMGIRPLTVDNMNETAVRRLQEIKDAVEAYDVAHGYYPKYLYGGDDISWKMKGTAASPDPLIKEGYLNAYPVNPLNLRKTYYEPRRVSGWRALWMGNKSDEFLHVRDLWSGIVDIDPRFGYNGSKMGNVLPDPSIPETRLPNDVKFAIQSRWLPGGFFYRSYDLNGDSFADAYIMGVCGDESKQASVDCYDARLDTLTTTINGQVVPSAYDGIRDGVIYRVHQGFEEFHNPRQGQMVPHTPFSQMTPPDGAVTGSTAGGENVEN
jgi:hypothetical protein